MYVVLKPIIVDAADMASDIISGAKDCSRWFNCSFQAVWNGSSPSGTLKIQASNNGSDWSDIPDFSTTISGNSDSHLFDVKEISWHFIRIAYIRASGSGSMTVYLNSRGW